MRSCSGFLLLYGALGWLLSLWFGSAALFVAIGVAIVMLLVNLFAGDDLITTVAGARRVERKEDAPELWRMVENLAITAGLPMPRVYIVHDESPNAFAAGRSPKQAIVAVTTGLLERLDEEELEGVLAHEMSHIRNYDVRLMTWAAVLAGSIALLASVFTRAMWFGGGDRRDNNPIVLIGGDRGPGARSGGGDPDPDGDQPAAGVRRRRVGRGADPLPAGPGVGAARDLGVDDSPRRGSATRRSRT